jgi:hypothetical protein
MPLSQPSQPTTNKVTTNASGINVVSGIPNSSGYDGPWYIEEQTLSISYRRVPEARMTDWNCSLDYVRWEGQVIRTQLAMFITAEVKGYKDWGHYDTSAWSQPQVLKVYAASADASGSTYGNLTASSWGPAGEVVTDQKYYRRVAWDDASGASEFTQSCFASNAFAEWHVNPYTEYASSGMYPVEDLLDNMYWAMGPRKPGCPQSPMMYWTAKCGFGALGSLFGPYDTSGEYMDTADILDEVGSRIGYLGLYNLPKADVNSSGDVLANTGVAAYRTSRHSW